MSQEERSRQEGSGGGFRSRREFLGALGGVLGVTLLGDPSALGRLAEAASPSGRLPSGRLPSGYVFHRVLTVGDGTRGLDDVEEIAPGVMINDRSEIIFHARLRSGAQAVYRMRISRERRPEIARPRLIVASGQELSDGVVVERIAVGDTNRTGAYVTVIRGVKDFDGVYIQRPGHEIKPLIKAADRTPGPRGRYSGSFGDVDLDNAGVLLVVARYTVPGKVRQGLFLLHHGKRKGGKLLIRTGHHIPNSKAVVTGLGLVNRRGRHFIVQVFGRRPKHRRRKNLPLEPSGFWLGRIDRGRGNGRLLAGSRQLRVRSSVIRGRALVGPRVHRDGSAATVVHRSSRRLELHRHVKGDGPRSLVRSGGSGGLLARTGSRSGGVEVETISAPVFGHEGLLFYRVIGKRAMQLLVASDDERRVILETGDRIDRKRVKVFNVGWHTDQADSRGRLAFQAELADGRTTIVVGTPV